MEYQKTAKDKAWDLERTKLRTEASMWQNRYNVENARCEYLTRQNQTLKDHIHDLEEAITRLTDGKMTPDEAVASLRSAAKIGEMASFIMGLERGGYF
jgi:hypothetical protein